MSILIGISLALAAALFAFFSGFDRDRSFYPTVLIIVASLYDLFGVMGGSTHALAMECIGTAAFVALAYLAFRYSPWLAVAGLAGHGIFDMFHGRLIDNPGVPPYWPAFCASYDVAAAIFLAWLLMRKKRLPVAAA